MRSHHTEEKDVIGEKERNMNNTNQWLSGKWDYSHPSLDGLYQQSLIDYKPFCERKYLDCQVKAGLLLDPIFCQQDSPFFLIISSRFHSIKNCHH